MKWSWMHLWMNDVKLIHMVIPFFYQSCLANDSQHFVPWSLKHSTTMLQPFAQVIEHCWDHAHALHNFIISMEMHNCMSLYAMRTCGIFVKIKIYRTLSKQNIIIIWMVAKEVCFDDIEQETKPPRNGCKKTLKRYIRYPCLIFCAKIVSLRT